MQFCAISSLDVIARDQIFSDRQLQIFLIIINVATNKEKSKIFTHDIGINLRTYQCEIAHVTGDDKSLVLEDFSTYDRK